MKAYNKPTIYTVSLFGKPIEPTEGLAEFRGDYGYISTTELDRVGGIHFFTTLEKAEAGLQELIKICPQEKVEPYCAVIDRVQLDELSMNDEIEWFLYDGQGRLIDRSVYLRNIEGEAKYPGRTSEQIRFQPGDFAEYITDDEYGSFATPVMIIHRPFMVGEKGFGIFLDEYYQVINGAGDTRMLNPKELIPLDPATPESVLDTIRQKYTEWKKAQEDDEEF